MINNEGVSLRFLCVKAVIILVQQKNCKEKIKEIRDNISILKMFPKSDFDADEKFGKVIDSNNKTI